MSEDSIEFSLSIAEQRAVGFIPAWSLAFLHHRSDLRCLVYYIRVCSGAPLSAPLHIVDYSPPILDFL